MIVVAPAGGWAARSRRSTPPQRHGERDRGHAREGNQSSTRWACPTARDRERERGREDAHAVADQRVSRAAHLGGRRLEDQERGGAQAREEQRLVERPRRQAAQGDREQRSDERVDRVPAVAPAVVQPALEPVAAGHSDEGALPVHDPYGGVRVLRDPVELFVWLEHASGKARLPGVRTIYWSLYRLAVAAAGRARRSGAARGRRCSDWATTWSARAATAASRALSARTRNAPCAGPTNGTGCLVLPVRAHPGSARRRRVAAALRARARAREALPPAWRTSAT